jgi:hypothetical protein
MGLWNRSDFVMMLFKSSIWFNTTVMIRVITIVTCVSLCAIFIHLQNLNDYLSASNNYLFQSLLPSFLSSFMHAWMPVFNYSLFSFLVNSPQLRNNPIKHLHWPCSHLSPW